jgi:hypothetical protein
VVVLFTKKLVELLGDEALSVRVVFLDEDAAARRVLEDEMALVGLLLREWREKGLVEVTASSWDAVRDLAAVGVRGSVVQIVRVSTSPALKDVKDGLDRRASFVDFPIGEATLDEWSARTTELLSSLL